MGDSANCSECPLSWSGYLHLLHDRTDGSDVDRDGHDGDRVRDLCVEGKIEVLGCGLVGAETITHPNLVAIYVVGQLGLVLYMFLVGSSFKLDILGAHTRQAGATSAAGIGVPLVLGGVLGWWMVDSGGYFTDKVAHWQGGLFVAAAVAITAFPMLARIINERGLADSPLTRRASSSSTASAG